MLSLLDSRMPSPRTWYRQSQKPPALPDKPEEVVRSSSSRSVSTNTSSLKSSSKTSQSPTKKGGHKKKGQTSKSKKH